MKGIWRLLRYMRPYLVYSLLSFVLMAVVGALASFRILLIKPILDNVLSAAASPDQVLVFTIPRTQHHINLQWLLAHHLLIAWSVVAAGLVGSAVV